MKPFRDPSTEASADPVQADAAHDIGSPKGPIGWETLSSEDALTEAAPEASWASGERLIAQNRANEVGQVVADRYELHGILGEGGMGRVFSAYDRERQCDVALKMVSFDKGDRLQLEARFRREIDALSQLKGPSFIEIYDHAIRGDCAYIAMELLKGETLQARLSREVRLTPFATLTLLRSVGRALKDAHDLSLIHRDLKPGNIFFSKQESDETIRILDFGIAKDLWLSSAGARLTRVGTLLGSPHYVSPEQAESKEVDERSDLWSLGVVLYRCLTGHRAFEGPPATLMLRILKDAHKPASQLVPNLPAAVDTFFDQALAKRPADRFQDVSSMVEAFERALGESEHVELNQQRTTAQPAERSFVASSDGRSEQTQVAQETYESYAARVTHEDRASNHQTVEIPAALLTGHAPSQPPISGDSRSERPFSESPWQAPPKGLAMASLYPRRALTLALIAFLAGTVVMFVLALSLWRSFSP